jgi:hypothetical protein
LLIVLTVFFGRFRPDAQDPLFKKIWELKPANCTEGSGRKKAEDQLQKYIRESLLKGNGFSLGDPYRLVPVPVIYDGIEFFPDPVSSPLNPSGLIFYQPIDCGCPK